MTPSSMERNAGSLRAAGKYMATCTALSRIHISSMSPVAAHVTELCISTTMAPSAGLRTP